MKKNSNSPMKKEQRAKSVRRDSRDVMSELVAQLRKQLDAESIAVRGEDKDMPDGERPNLDRLTVGVDLGDQWSNYCILGLGGETLTEGLGAENGETAHEDRGFLPPEALDTLETFGFNLLSLANNHSFDLKVKGIQNTLRGLIAERSSMPELGTTCPKLRLQVICIRRKALLP